MTDNKRPFEARGTSGLGNLTRGDIRKVPLMKSASPEKPWLKALHLFCLKIWDAAMRVGRDEARSEKNWRRVRLAAREVLKQKDAAAERVWSSDDVDAMVEKDWFFKTALHAWDKHQQENKFKFRPV